jgi:hypothetical protein
LEPSKSHCQIKIQTQAQGDEKIGEETSGVETSRILQNAGRTFGKLLKVKPTDKRIGIGEFRWKSRFVAELLHFEQFHSVLHFLALSN